MDVSRQFHRPSALAAEVWFGASHDARRPAIGRATLTVGDETRWRGIRWDAPLSQTYEPDAMAGAVGTTPASGRPRSLILALALALLAPALEPAATVIIPVASVVLLASALLLVLAFAVRPAPEPLAALTIRVAWLAFEAPGLRRHILAHGVAGKDAKTQQRQGAPCRGPDHCAAGRLLADRASDGVESGAFHQNLPGIHQYVYRATVPFTSQSSFQYSGLLLGGVRSSHRA